MPTYLVTNWNRLAVDYGGCEFLNRTNLIKASGTVISEHPEITDDMARLIVCLGNVYHRSSILLPYTNNQLLSALNAYVNLNYWPMENMDLDTWTQEFDAEAAKVDKLLLLSPGYRAVSDIEQAWPFLRKGAFRGFCALLPYEDLFGSDKYGRETRAWCAEHKLKYVVPLKELCSFRSVLVHL